MLRTGMSRLQSFLYLSITFLLASVFEAGAAALPDPQFLRQWGVHSNSGADTAFDYVADVACGPEGNVYVVDEFHYKIKVFSRQGVFIRSVTVPNSSNGGVSIPVQVDAIAVDADTNLYAMDGVGIVYKFSPQDTKVGEWRSKTLTPPGTIPGFYFWDIATSPHYVYLYTSRGDTHTQAVILQLDHEGNVHREIQAAASSVDTTVDQVGLTADWLDNVYYPVNYYSGGPTTAQVRMVDSTGTVARSWNVSADYVTAIHADDTGNLYCGTSNDEIVVLADSTETMAYDGSDSPGAAFEDIRGLAGDSLGFVYVADGSNSTDRVVGLRLDYDGDGLRDGWEKYGVIAKPPFRRFRMPFADVTKPDLYVEMDYLQSYPFSSTAATRDSLAFAAAPTSMVFPPGISGSGGIRLHLQQDEPLSSPSTLSGDILSTFRTIKASHFGTPAERSDSLTVAKRLVYRYCVVGDGLTGGVTGTSELPGNDFVLGVPGSISDTLVVHKQSAAFMHELGHALGLSHGGQDAANYKPNYHSIMNYLWEFKMNVQNRPDIINDGWRLSYSALALDSLDETSLNERKQTGINDISLGSNVKFSIPFGPVHCDPSGAMRLVGIAPNKGKVDWNRDGDRDDTGVSRDLTAWDNNCVAPPTAYTTLKSYTDWDRLIMLPRIAHGWQVDAEDSMAYLGATELPIATVDSLLFAIRDCNENGIDDGWDIYYGTSTDVEHDGIPDECEEPRVVGVADTLLACPGGDGDSLIFNADVSDLYVIGSGADDYMRIDSLGTGMAIWRENGQRVAVGDTIREYTRATGDDDVQRGYFAVGRISGCGRMTFSVYAGGDSLVARNLRPYVKSFDFDGLAVGSSDRLDTLSWHSLVTCDTCYACGDFNGDRLSQGAADLPLLREHVGHHVQRGLTAPNGGQVYKAGDSVTITWMHGWGDSARVAVRCVRDSAADTTLVVGDVLDTCGTYSWTVPTSMKAGADWRVEVVHTAGYYKVDYRDVGKDENDGQIAIQPITVDDLAVIAGKTTAALTWTEPTQTGGIADTCEVRCRMNDTIADANFWNSIPLCCEPPTGTGGAEHCMEIDSLTCNRLYSFGMKIKMGGVWSAMSNAASVTTTSCSGNQSVFCDEGDMMAGGGGGGESAQVVAASVRELRPRPSGGDEIEENSLLWGGGGGVVEDLYKLPGWLGPKDGQYQIRLRESGGRAADLDQLSLGIVDHAPELIAVPGASVVYLGTAGPVSAVIDPSGSDVSRVLSGSGSESYVGMAGQYELMSRAG